MTRLERMGRAFSAPNVIGFQAGACCAVAVGALFRSGYIIAGIGAVFAVLYLWLSFKMAELRAMEAGLLGEIRGYDRAVKEATEREIRQQKLTTSGTFVGLDGVAWTWTRR